MGFEDVRNRHACSLLDLGIGIGKRDAEPCGEPATDRGFAGAHHTNQHDGAPPKRGRERRIVRRDTQTIGQASVVHLTSSESRTTFHNRWCGAIAQTKPSTSQDAVGSKMRLLKWEFRHVFTKLYIADKPRKFGSSTFRSWRQTERECQNERS